MRLLRLIRDRLVKTLKELMEIWGHELKEKKRGKKMTKLLEFKHFDGKARGLLGIINAIKWLGIREWFQICRVRHCIANEGDVYEAKTGN